MGAIAKQPLRVRLPFAVVEEFFPDFEFHLVSEFCDDLQLPAGTFLASAVHLNVKDDRLEFAVLPSEGSVGPATPCEAIASPIYRFEQGRTVFRGWGFQHE